MDLGSSGPVLIPGTFGGHNLIAFSSKMGRAYRLSNPVPEHIYSDLFRKEIAPL